MREIVFSHCSSCCPIILEMSTMKYYILLVVLLCFSLSECLILPLLFSPESGNCDQQSQFKNIKCTYNGIGLYTVVDFGPSDNPQLRHTIRLLIDSGSSETWLITSATRLLHPNGTQRRWEDTFAPTINILNYTPQASDGLNIIDNPGYHDGAKVLLQAYKNHQLQFHQSPGEPIIVPIDLYFALLYVVPDSNIPLNDHGTLGLTLSKRPKHVKNLFLHQFLEANPDYPPMMSFDINWNNGDQQTSCFGLGESLPIKKDLVGETITLRSNSTYWITEFVSYMQVVFPSGKRIIIKPETKYEKTIGQTVYLNTMGITYLTAVTDSGSTNVGLSDYFLKQMDPEDQEIFMKDYTFNCNDYSKVLPNITMGFEDSAGEKIDITIPVCKLYRRGDQPGECHSLLGGFPSYNGNLGDFTHLGLPFFASVYLEMHWEDTRNIKDWNDMESKAILIITAK